MDNEIDLDKMKCGVEAKLGNLVEVQYRELFEYNDKVEEAKCNNSNAPSVRNKEKIRMAWEGFNDKITEMTTIEGKIELAIAQVEIDNFQTQCNYHNDIDGSGFSRYNSNGYDNSDV